MCWSSAGQAQKQHSEQANFAAFVEFFEAHCAQSNSTPHTAAGVHHRLPPPCLKFKSPERIQYPEVCHFIYSPCCLHPPAVGYQMTQMPATHTTLASTSSSQVLECFGSAGSRQLHRGLSSKALALVQTLELPSSDPNFAALQHLKQQLPGGKIGTGAPESTQKHLPPEEYTAAALSSDARPGQLLSSFERASEYSFQAQMPLKRTANGATPSKQAPCSDCSDTMLRPVCCSACSSRCWHGGGKTDIKLSNASPQNAPTLSTPVQGLGGAGSHWTANLGAPMSGLLATLCALCAARHSLFALPQPHGQGRLACATPCCTAHAMVWRGLCAMLAALASSCGADRLSCRCTEQHMLRVCRGHGFQMLNQPAVWGHHQPLRTLQHHALAARTLSHLWSVLLSSSVSQRNIRLDVYAAQLPTSTKTTMSRCRQALVYQIIRRLQR